MKTTLAVVAAAAVAALAALGCTLAKPLLRGKDAEGPTHIGTGRLLGPDRSVLTVWIVTRPLGDPAIGDEVWNHADPQAIDEASRKALEASGLRIGRITGDLPPEVRSLLEATGKDRVDPTTIGLSMGETTLAPVGSKVDKIDLFTSRGGSPTGKTYREAQGALRLSISGREGGAVALRVVPEVHHGPIRPIYGPAPGGAFTVGQFSLRQGQQEDAFRELAASMDLRDGQLALFGLAPGHPGSLGEFLCTAADRGEARVERLLLVRASRTDPGPAEPPMGTPPALVPADAPAAANP